MVQILKDGAVLAMTESPTFIKLHEENGCFVLCGEDEAQGIAHAGEVYHLLGRPDLEGRDSVILTETDTGIMVMQTQNTMADTDALNIDQEYRITMLELGLSAI